MSRPRRFPNGVKWARYSLPPEVIEELEARGGREWLFTALGFDYGPKPNTNTARVKQARTESRRGLAALQGVMNIRSIES